MKNPFLVLENKWHKINSEDHSKLVCGIEKPPKSEQSKPNTKVCTGCKTSFPSRI